VRKTSTYARKRAHSNHHGYSYSDTLGSMRLLRELERFTPAQLNSLTLPPSMAYQAISTGQARPGDFDTLAEVVNVTLIRAERIELVGYGRPDATPEELAEERATGAKAVALCCEAQDALMHMRQRFDGQAGPKVRAANANVNHIRHASPLRAEGLDAGPYGGNGWHHVFAVD
jgi:hypothetical protein